LIKKRIGSWQIEEIGQSFEVTKAENMLNALISGKTSVWRMKIK
jgi:hypothetical protein